MSTTIPSIAEPALGRSRAFGAFVAALGISKLGDALYLFALPWIAYELTGSALVMGTLYAAEVVPVVVCGVVAGAWVDRYGARRMMLASDVARAVLVSSIPILYMAGSLRTWHLYAVAFLLGIFTLLFDVSTVAAIPHLDHDLTRANAVHQSVVQAASVVGPAVAGSTIAAIGAFGALWIDVISFAATVVVVAQLPVRDLPSRDQAFWSDVAAGFRWLSRGGAIRTLALQAAVGNFGYAMVMSVMLFYLRADLLLSAQRAGFVNAAAGVGGVAASLAIVRLRRHLAPATLYRRILITGLLGYAVLLVAPVWWLASIALAAVGACNMAWVIVTTSMRQALIPRPLLGRVVSLSRTLSVAAMPLGAAAGGLLAEHDRLPLVFVAAVATKAIEIVIAQRPEVQAL